MNKLLLLLLIGFSFININSRIPDIPFKSKSVSNDRDFVVGEAPQMKYDKEQVYLTYVTNTTPVVYLHPTNNAHRHSEANPEEKEENTN